MLSHDQITASLSEAEHAIRTGSLTEDPHHFLERLWAQVYEESPTALQPEVYERLQALAQLLGIDRGTAAQQRLGGPAWDTFLAALEELPDATEDALVFWRAIDHASEPLLRGMQGDDRTTMEQAITSELSVRGIAERTG